MIAEQKVIQMVRSDIREKREVTIVWGDVGIEHLEGGNILNMSVEKKWHRWVAVAVALLMLATLVMPMNVSRASADSGLRNPRITENGTVIWDCVEFGHYPQSSDGNGGFNNDPIKWRVLSVEGNEVLLLADKKLDVIPFHGVSTAISFETSDLQNWLNNIFIKESFLEKEQKIIIDNSYGKLFVPSKKEISNNTFGFIGNKERAADNTDYVIKSLKEHAKGADLSDINANPKTVGAYWLREPSNINGTPIVVRGTGKGYIELYGKVTSTIICVRPMVKINIENSNLWSYAGTVSSDGTVDEDTISLNMKWGTDNFSFINEAAAFKVDSNGKYQMDEAWIDNSNFLYIDKALMKQKLENWGGSCFGMSTLLLQLFTQNQNISDLQNNALIPYDLKPPTQNSTVQNYIGLYQASCTTSQYKSLQFDFGEKDAKQQLSILLDKLKNLKRTNTPLLIDYAWVTDPTKSMATNEEDGWTAHAVLAYALETEGAPYVYEGKEYAYRVRTLDPNLLYTEDLNIEESNQKCLYLTKELDEFYIPLGGVRADNATTYSLKSKKGDGDEYGEAIIQAVSDDISVLPPKSSGKNNNNFVDQGIVAAGSTIILDGKVINGYNGTVPGIEGRALTPGGTKNTLLLKLDDATHTVKFVKDAQNIGYLSNNTYVDVSASKNSTALFSKSKSKVELDNQKGTFNIKYIHNDEIPEITGHELEVQGNGAKEITLTESVHGLIVEGENLEGIKVSTENGETIINKNQEKVIIKENTKGELVAEDANKTTTGELISKKVSQNITAKSFTKTYGNKPFNLNAKAKTKLSYKSSNIKVATVSSSGRVTLKGPGKATITITATASNQYKSASKNITITVKPKKATLKKAKSTKKRTLKVMWKRDTKATGYQVVIAQNKKFKKGKKNITISKNKTVKRTIKKLKARKTYYVKVRAYKKVGKTKIYGAYSKVKKVKVR